MVSDFIRSIRFKGAKVYHLCWQIKGKLKNNLGAATQLLLYCSRNLSLPALLNGWGPKVPFVARCSARFWNRWIWWGTVVKQSTSYNYVSALLSAKYLRQTSSVIRNTFEHLGAAFCFREPILSSKIVCQFYKSIKYVKSFRSFMTIAWSKNFNTRITQAITI